MSNERVDIGPFDPYPAADLRCLQTPASDPTTDGDLGDAKIEGHICD